MKFRDVIRLYYRMQPVAAVPRNQRSLLQRLVYKVQRGIYLREMRRYSCFIPPNAKIGPGLRLHHDGLGVVIAQHAVIGKNVKIVHGVTIGSNLGKDGKAVEGGSPIIEDDVFIGAHAQIIGRCRIGRGAQIGAGVVLVNATVPEGAVIVNKGAYDLTERRYIYPQD